jgi:hypothetical protein
MNTWNPIRYLGFWDVPLVFLTRHNGRTFLFDCPFDEHLEDYAESYRVYSMPDLADEELPKDWTTLRQRATGFLGEIPVARVRFDPTKRQHIDSSVLDELIGAAKIS